MVLVNSHFGEKNGIGLLKTRRTFSPVVFDQLVPPHSFNTRLRDDKAFCFVVRYDTEASVASLLRVNRAAHTDLALRAECGRTDVPRLQTWPSGGAPSRSRNPHRFCRDSSKDGYALAPFILTLNVGG